MYLHIMRNCTLLIIILLSTSANSFEPYLRSNTELKNGYIVHQTKTQTMESRSGTGPQIQLIGMIHVGEKKYYKAIEKAVQDSDLVLFEGSRIDPKEMQTLLALSHEEQKTLAYCRTNNKDMTHRVEAMFTGLSAQYDELRFNATHHLNADLTIPFSEQQFHGELLNCEKTRLEQKKHWDDIWDSPELLGRPNPSSCRELYPILEQINAKLLQEITQLTSLSRSVPSYTNRLNGLLKPVYDEAQLRTSHCLVSDKWLLHDRNEAVVNQLKIALQQKGHQKIAIVYGAAHMPDLENQIASELGYVPTSIKWYDLATAPAELSTTSGIYYRVEKVLGAGTYLMLRRAIWKNTDKNLEVTLMLPLRTGDEAFINSLQDKLNRADRILAVGSMEKWTDSLTHLDIDK
jgi:uncharacterized protein YbaP (TraB family)